MNNLLSSNFNPSQTTIIIIVAVLVVALIVLNIVIAYYFNKRGERKLHDFLLQHQREALMQQLAEMRAKGTADDDKPANIRPIFVPFEEVSALEETAPADAEEPVEGVDAEEPVEEPAEGVKAEELVEETVEKVDAEESVGEAVEEAALSDTEGLDGGKTEE